MGALNASKTYIVEVVFLRVSAFLTTKTSLSYIRRELNIVSLNEAINYVELVV